MGEKKLMEQGEILTSEDLAGRWKVSKRFIEEARNKYGLPFHKMGRLVRFKTKEVDHWFEQRKQVL